MEIKLEHVSKKYGRHTAAIRPSMMCQSPYHPDGFMA